MRIAAVSTINKSYLLSNYGSFFQHYALRQVLAKWGIQSFRVRPHGERCSGLQILLDGIKDTIRPMYWKVKRLPGREQHAKHLRFRNKLNKKFLRDFRRLIAPFDESMQFTDQTCGIKGGDQVLGLGDDAMWLSDILEGNPKVCYAASRDWRSLCNDEEVKRYLHDRLSTFSAIGIRESRGVEMISSITGRKEIVARVADPVLLLSVGELRNVAVKKAIFSKPTLLCYLVNIRSERDLQFKALVQLSKVLDCELRIIGIQGTEDFVPSNFLMSPSPTEFLRAVEEAKYFITNSFHGLVFGLMFQKQLVFMPQRNLPEQDQNERQMELLSRYGLLNRLIKWNASAEELASIILSNIDWHLVSATMNDERDFSISWLKESLRIK